MDRAEYQDILDQIQNCVAKKDYQSAYSLAKKVEWRRVKSFRTLNMVADIYEVNHDYTECKKVLLIAKNRATVGKGILYRLVEVCLKLGEVDNAKAYYREYLGTSPSDSDRLLLEYKIGKADNRPLEDQIRTLEEYKEIEYTEKWSYELALLYSKAGEKEKCIEVCDDMMLWFSEGKYVLKAMELKQRYATLTPSQQEYYNKEQKDSDPRLYTGDVDFVNDILARGKAPNSTEEIKLKEALSQETFQPESLLDRIEAAGAKLTRDVHFESTSVLQLSGDEIDKVSVTSPMFMGGTPDLKSELAESVEKVYGTEKPAEEIREEDYVDPQAVKERPTPSLTLYPGDIFGATRVIEEPEAPAETRVIPDLAAAAPEAAEAAPEAVPEVAIAEPEVVIAEPEAAVAVPEVIEAEPEIVPQAVIQEPEIIPEPAAEAAEEAVYETEAAAEAVVEEVREAEEAAAEEAAEIEETIAGEAAEAKEAIAEEIAEAKEAVTEEAAAVSEEIEEAAAEEAAAAVEAEAAAEEPVETVAEEIDSGLPKKDAPAPTFPADWEIPDPEESEEVKRTHTIPLGKVGQNTVPISVEEVIRHETPEERRIRILNNANPTKMSDEQRQVFTYFARIPGIDTQILEAVTGVYKYAGEHTSKRGNIAVMGAAGMGKTRLSYGLIVMMCKDMGLDAAKIARVSGERMNEVDPAEIVARMSGGFLAIEDASDMKAETIEKLNNAMEFRTDCMILIIEDEKNAVRALFKKYPAFAEKFTGSVSIPAFTNDELVTFARTYCAENNCELDEMGILALYTMISNNQTEEQPVSIATVKEMVDGAIAHAKRTGRKSRKGSKSKKIVLYEKDFIV